MRLFPITKLCFKLQESFSRDPEAAYPYWLIFGQASLKQLHFLTINQDIKREFSYNPIVA